MRPTIKSLIIDIGSADEKTVYDALMKTYLLLGYSYKCGISGLLDHDEAIKRDFDQLPEIWKDLYTPEALRSEFSSSLADEYLDLEALTPAETDGLIQATVPLLERPPGIVNIAVGALGQARSLTPVRPLITLLKASAKSSEQLAGTIISSLSTILTSLATRRPISEEAEAIVSEAFTALREAKENGGEAAREAAEQELKWITHHLGRSY